LLLLLFTVWSKLHLLIFPFANRKGAQGTIPKSLDNPNDRIAGATYYPCPETQSPRGINTQTLRGKCCTKILCGHDPHIQIREEEKFCKIFGLNNRKEGSTNDETSGNRYPDFHVSFPDLIMINSENAEKGDFPTTAPLMRVKKFIKMFLIHYY
jgi:hypothetical protein